MIYLLKQYHGWCENVQPRLKRWQGHAIIASGMLIGLAGLLLIVAILPNPINVVVLVVGTTVIAALFNGFSNANSQYWRRYDDIHSDSLRRTLKTRDIVDKTYGKKK